MRGLVDFFLAGVPVTPPAAQALAATMADWRHEAATETSVWRRCRVGVVGVASVARVLAAVGLKDLPGAWRAPLLWRSATVLILLAFVVLFDPPVRFAHVLSGWDLVLFSTVRAAHSVFLLLPLAVFIGEVTGRQSRPAPSAGAFTLIAIGIASVVSILPEFTTLQAHIAWTHFGNPATPPPIPLPSAYRLFVDGPTIPMTISRWISFGSTFGVLVVATGSLGILAYQVRVRRGVYAGLIGLCPFLGVFASIYGVMTLSALLGVALPDAVAFYWPIGRFVAMLSVTVLPALLAAHLARTTQPRPVVSVAEVTT